MPFRPHALRSFYSLFKCIGQLLPFEEEAAILFDDYQDDHEDAALEMLRKEQDDASLALAIAMQEKFEMEEVKAAERRRPPVATFIVTSLDAESVPQEAGKKKCLVF